MPRPTISPTNFLSHHLRENPYITKLPFDLHLTGDSCEGEGEHYSWFHQDKDRKAGLVQTGSNCLPRYVTPLPTYSGQKMMIPPPHGELPLASHTTPLPPWPLSPEIIHFPTAKSLLGMSFLSLHDDSLLTLQDSCSGAHSQQPA